MVYYTGSYRTGACMEPDHLYVVHENDVGSNAVCYQRSPQCVNGT